jgi:hypothetical protein
MFAWKNRFQSTELVRKKLVVDAVFDKQLIWLLLIKHGLPFENQNWKPPLDQQSINVI